MDWVPLKRLCRDKHAELSSKAVCGPLVPAEVCLAASELREISLWVGAGGRGAGGGGWGGWGGGGGGVGGGGGGGGQAA